MRLRNTYIAAAAQRFALEPPPYGADWDESWRISLRRMMMRVDRLSETAIALAAGRSQR